MKYWKEKAERQEKIIQELKSQLKDHRSEISKCGYCRKVGVVCAWCAKRHKSARINLCKSCSKICNKCKKIYCPTHVKSHECI